MPRRREKHYIKIGDCEFADDAFWSRVEHNAQTGCREWTGPKNNAGYGLCGHINARGLPRMMSAHRIAWILTHGRLVPDGQQVQHTCHNLLCCTPEHLKLGDHQTKMKDMMSDNRHGFQLNPGHKHILDHGSWHRHYENIRKYSEEEIQWARAATMAEIAEHWGVDLERARKMKRLFRGGYRWLPYDRKATELRRGPKPVDKAGDNPV